MNRLEEIKKSLKECNEVNFENCITYSDIEFLLNEVERLNKIKAKAIEGLNSYRDAAFEIHGEVYAVGSVAKETLKEIEGIK